MSAAVKSVLNGEECLREAARLYNVSVETLRRHVNGSVDLNCKPGPATVLSEEEESKLAIYLVRMTDMGFGLTREGCGEPIYIINNLTLHTHAHSINHHHVHNYYISVSIIIIKF